MAYNTLLQDEGIESNYLVIAKPTQRLTSWTLFSGTTYYASISYHVAAVKVDGASLTEASSTSLSSGEFYYDFENSNLYINSGSNPSSSFVAADFELYWSTRAAHWYRIPTNDTQRQVFFDPVITRSPSFTEDLSDLLFGYIPSQTTTIGINNSEHELEPILQESSFNEKVIDVYHWLGEDLDTSNIKKIITGVTQNVRYQDQTITISVLSNNYGFRNELRNPGTSFINTSDFPNADPYFVGRPVRYVYGMAENMKLINIDYEVVNPTTSNNRDWLVRDEGSKANSFSELVPASPSSTTTRTYLASVDGLQIGDYVFFNKASAEYGRVNNINRSSNYIEHAALSVSCTSGDSVSRGTCGSVKITQDGADYYAQYNRDWTESVVSGCLVINFSSSLESNLGINTLTGLELVTARVYGKQVDTTIGGSPFGTDSDLYGGMTHPVVILYDILVNRFGLSESALNTSSFTALESSISSEIGFAIPAFQEQDFPSYKDVIAKIATSALLRLYVNNESKWEVSEIKPQGTNDYTITDDEIYLGTIDIDIDYKDIKSDIIVSYRKSELPDRSDNERYHSDIAEYLHGISKQKTFNSYLLESSDASTLATRLGYIFGDRSATFSLTTHNRFLNIEVGEIVEIELEKLIGYTYTEGTTHTRKYTVVSIDKGKNRVALKLVDQKGIEDNSGSW